MADRKEYMKNWHKEHPEAAKQKNDERNRKYAEDSEYKDRINRENVLKCYRTTPKWYTNKLSEQNGHCALCPNTTGSKGKSLHVDHKHECCGTDKRFTCGKCNRGLLCNACNIRLGYLEQILKEATSVVPKWDTWLSKALAYLDSYTKS